MRIAKCAQKPSRPLPINYPPGESPPIPKGSESLDTDSPRAPEIVDFAAPGSGTWPRRHLPSQIVYEQQQWGGAMRVGSPSSVSRYSLRQSEMSFGILDYYTRDPSPTRNPTLLSLPHTSKVPQGLLQACPNIGTPVIDPAMEKFDFGLGSDGKRGPWQLSGANGDASVSAAAALDAHSGAEQCRQDKDDIASTPSSPPPSKSEKADPAKPTYSLFPKDTTPPSRPSITLTNRQDSSLTGPCATASHGQPDPSYRPRKESLTSSLRSRKDSLTSYRHHSSNVSNNNRIPLRLFSASSTTTSNGSAYTTPRTSNAQPNSATGGARTSSSTATASPPDSAGTSKSGLQSQSRWSEDTITSPSPTALGFFSSQPSSQTHSSHRRASFGSLLRGVEHEGQSGQYPACFFEDDDDEIVPLRRKLHFGRGSRGVLQQGKGRSGKDWDQKGIARGKIGWRRWVLCGCAS